jgi:hypothetical protein
MVVTMPPEELELQEQLIQEEEGDLHALEDLVLLLSDIQRNMCSFVITIIVTSLISFFGIKKLRNK